MRSAIRVLVLVLIPGLVFSDVITKNQGDKIQKQAAEMQLNVSKLLSLSSAMNIILNNGGMFSIPGSTQTYIITAQQSQDIFNNYSDLKNTICIKECGQLP